MAKKSKKQAGRPLKFCVGKDCDGIELPYLPFYTQPGFSYTTPSHHPRRGKKERLAHGCIYDKAKKKFTGDVCIKEEKQNGKVVCIDKAPDSYCKPTTKPCDADRVTCPVQLIFIQGKPNLRFCRTKGEPGYIVPAGSPTQAQRKAAKACSKWGQYQTTFFDKNAPQIIEEAKKKHPDSPWGSGLGQPPTPKNVPETPRSAFPLLVPIIGGIVALIFAFSKK